MYAQEAADAREQENAKVRTRRVDGGTREPTARPTEQKNGKSDTDGRAEEAQRRKNHGTSPQRPEQTGQRTQSETSPAEGTQHGVGQSTSKKLKETTSESTKGHEKQTQNKFRKDTQTRHGTQQRTRTPGGTSRREQQTGSLEEITTRLRTASAGIDWGEEVENVMAAEGKQKRADAYRQESAYTGDDMSKKGDRVGCRVVTFNAQGQCGNMSGDTPYLEKLIQQMQKLKADIVVINEPGAVRKITPQLRGIAERNQCTAVIRTGEEGTTEGTIVILTQAWRMVHESTQIINGKGLNTTRAIQLIFKEVGKQGRITPLNKLAVYAVYGYANKGKRAESKALWNAVKESIGKWRKQHPLSSTVLAGDLNAAKWSSIDTDRPDIEHEQQLEKDAETIIWIEKNTPLRDLYREKFPHQRGVTRTPQKGKALTDAARRLDQIWATKEIANHPATKIGIATSHDLGGDHMPVVADLPIDCAGQAEGTTPTWTPTTTKKLQLKPEEEVEPSDTVDYSMKFRWMYIANMVKTENRDRRTTLDNTAESILTGMYEASIGTIGKEKTLYYPKKASRTPTREGWGYTLDTWKKHMVGACRAIYMRDRDKIKVRLKKAAWRHEDIPMGIAIDKMPNIWEKWEQGEREEIKTRLTKQIQEITKHRSREAQKEKRQRIAEAIKNRNNNFAEETGKGKGKVLASKFRKSREYQELKWVRDDKDNLVSKPEEVGEVVRDFFSKWFKSRITVEERWGSWDKMLNLDTTSVGDEFKQFIDECYREPMHDMTKKAEESGMWEHILKAITLEELQEAIKKAKKETAAGPSQVSIDMIKALTGTATKVLLQFYNRCIQEKRVPDNINQALMRLLPKKGKGKGKKGKGYKMSANNKQQTIPQQLATHRQAHTDSAKAHTAQEENMRLSSQEDKRTSTKNGTGTKQGSKDTKQSKGEVNGMMFVDDSIWPTGSAAHMQEVIRMHETFCNFHQIYIHKKKSEYVSINAEGAQVRWTPTGRDTTPKGEEHKQHLETKEGREEMQKEQRQVMGEEFAQKKRSGTKGRRGTGQPLKYLGVWYDTGWGWHTQRHKTESTLTEELKYIQEASIPLEMAIYAINTKVIPKIIYPLQVAVIPQGTLEAWDRKVRSALRKAGKLPVHLPENMYYLGKHDGGLGLRSIRQSCEENKIKIDIQIRNDWVTDHTPTVHSDVVQQAWARYNQHSEREEKKGRMTGCADIQRALNRHNIKVEATPAQYRLSTAAADAQEAYRTSMLRGKRKYTDGSTTRNPDRSGWGLVEYDRDMTQPARTIQGRLRGMQDNYKAESQALLQALIQQHPVADTEVYIDNHAVVKRWEVTRAEDVRARSKAPCRAVWNRIDRIKKIREAAGGVTTVKWVRAHVEEAKESSKQTAEEQEQEQQKITAVPRKKKQAKAPPPQCACGEQKGKCKKTHPHHIGNDRADEAANKGRMERQTEEDRGDPRQGEDPWYMIYREAYCEGDITTEIKKATRLTRLTEMQNSSKPHDRLAARAVTMSDTCMRKYVMNVKEISTRFVTRAISDSLPTYKNEAKKLGEGSTYEYMYGEYIQGGLCSCGSGEVEDNHHVFCKCKLTQIERDEAMQAIQNIWGDNIHTKTDWGLIDYITQETAPGWNQWWGWLGLVPTQVAEGKSMGTRKRLKETAKALAVAGYKIWKKRNDKVQEWEEVRGITNNKKEVRNKQWKQTTQKRARRGRPEKPLEELSPAYRDIKINQEHTRTLLSQGYNNIETKAIIKARVQDRKNTTHAATIYGDTRLDKWTTPTNPEQHKQQFKREQTIRPTGILPRPYIHSAKKHKKVPKHLKILDRKELNEDELEAFRTARTDGKCAFGACGRQATTTCPTCKYEDPRCSDHEKLLCRGKSGTRECRCAVNAEVIEVEGNQRKKNRGGEKAQRKGVNDKKRRCYEVDIGDIITVDDSNEGPLTGKVTGMIWDHHGGFRVPDAIEFEWTNQRPRMKPQLRSTVSHFYYY